MFSPNSAVRLGCTAIPMCYFSKPKQKFLFSFYQCSNFFLKLLNPSFNYDYVLTRATVRFQTGAFCICGGPRNNGTGFSRRSTAVLPYKYNSTNAPYSYFIRVLNVYIELELASTSNKIPVFINNELCIFLRCLLLCMNLTKNTDYFSKF